MASMIDRYLLRYFLAVVDTGSFSRGAVQVNVTQPTLSVGISKLERLCGAKLFHRSSQRVHLTDAGSRLLPHARRIESEFNLMASRVGDSGDDTGLLRLGVLSTIPTPQLEALATAHRGLDPHRPLEIVEGNERELLSRLDRGRIDIALTLLRPGEARQRHSLYQEGYGLALPEAHRFAGAEDVRGEELAAETMIVRRHCEALSDTSRYFTTRGVRPRFSFRTTNDERAMALVRAGMGITVMPDSHRAPGVSRAGLSGFDLRREVGFTWSGGGTGLSRAAEAIVEAGRVLSPPP